MRLRMQGYTIDVYDNIINQIPLLQTLSETNEQLIELDQVSYDFMITLIKCMEQKQEQEQKSMYQMYMNLYHIDHKITMKNLQYLGLNEIFDTLYPSFQDFKRLKEYDAEKIAQLVFEHNKNVLKCGARHYYHFTSHYWEEIIGTKDFVKLIAQTLDIYENKYDFSADNEQEMSEHLQEWICVNFDPIIEYQLDRNKYLIVFENGIYDLRTHRFRNGDPCDYMSKNSSVLYPYEPLFSNFNVLNNILIHCFPNESERQCALDHFSECLFFDRNLGFPQPLIIAVRNQCDFLLMDILSWTICYDECYYFEENETMNTILYITSKQYLNEIDNHVKRYTDKKKNYNK